MNFSDDLIEQIKQQSDIVEIISDVVELNKTGQNFKGLCPFHAEKTPSFVVSPDKKIYKCFGCGASGNVISFMKNYHGLTFIEALKELATKAGISLPDEDNQKHSEKNKKRDLVLKAMEDANNFYRKLLNTTAGKNALAYFHGRGYHSKIIEEFQLGYSPDSWRDLKDELKKRDYSEETLLDAGLIIHNKEKNSIYDRFRNRAMFPIHDIRGKVIAFGSRILTDNKDQPKYINSPQTLVFDKSKTLYGLFHALKEIRQKKYAILVEGYSDVISLHKAGFKTAVASSGTSLTEEQLNVLYRYCKKVYFCFDSDAAGKKATEKAINMGLKNGFEVMIIKLPEGEDPDSIIRESSPDVFGLHLEKAFTFVDYMVEKYRDDGMLDSPNTMARSIRNLVKMVSLIPDRLQHDLYLRRIADLLKITDKQLESIYSEKSFLERKDKAKNTKKAIEKNETNDEAAKTIKDRDLINVLPVEKLLFQLVLNSNDIMENLLKRNFDSEKLISEDAKKIMNIIMENYIKDANLIDRIMTHEDIEQEFMDFMVSLSINFEEGSSKWSETDVFEGIENPGKNLENILKNLELIRVNNAVEEIKSKLKDASPENQNDLIMEFNELIKKKKSLQ